MKRKPGMFPLEGFRCGFSIDPSIVSISPDEPFKSCRTAIDVMEIEFNKDREGNMKKLLADAIDLELEVVIWSMTTGMRGTA